MLRAADVPKPADKPNIVFVLVDDLGWKDLGCLCRIIGTSSNHHPTCNPMKPTLILVAALALITPVWAAPALDAAKPAAFSQSNKPRLQWFTDAHFGLFLHWGVYSQLGDEWRGQKCERAEQIQWEKRIPIADYTRVAGQFNPVKFDAARWVRAARDAGMKYIVITAKHHDGFAMFDSPGNAYNIVKATPFGRDPMKDLAMACKADGIKLCFYYSLGREWHDDSVPNPPNSKRGNNWDYPVNPKRTLDTYLERKAKPQLRELLTQYGPVGAIWFDTPEGVTPAQSRALKEHILSLQPGCLINSRVANGMGDYDISEQFIPGFKKNAKPWESCITMNHHWGYDRFDDHWKSPDAILRHLVDIASKGGNLLLNIGPTGQGEFPPESLDCLAAIGQWMAINGEAIHGAGPTCFGQEFSGKPAVNHSGVDANGQEIGTPNKPIPRLPTAASHGVGKAKDAIAAPAGWRCTTKQGVIYLHLLDWPGPSFTLENLPGTATAATFLDGGKPVAFTQHDQTLSLTLPKDAPHQGINVIKILVP